MNISEKIKNYRKKADLTQEQVANYLGVTTPAVNKWEKGSTYPDISLLPALARLLKMDMNELFSFREELTELEISQFTEDLTQTTLSKGIISAFEMATDKIRQYPHCDYLIYIVATILDSGLTLSNMNEQQQHEYTHTIISWLERSTESQNDKVRIPSIYTLASKYIQLQKYEEARLLLNKLPDILVDSGILHAELLATQEETELAITLLDSKLLHILTHILSYLTKMIKLEEQAGHHTEAEQIADIAEQMVSIFDLYAYAEITPHLTLARTRKDVKACLHLIKEILAKASKPWNYEQSPLYHKIPFQYSYRNIGATYTEKLIHTLQTHEDYEFLRNDSEFSNLLVQYQKTVS